MKKIQVLASFVTILFLVQMVAIFQDGLTQDADASMEYLNTSWQFGRADNSIISHKITLLPGGKIQGYYHPNEDHWGVEGSYLVFYHKSGKPSCRFTSSQRQGGRRVLSGPFLFNNRITHVLKEIR